MILMIEPLGNHYLETKQCNQNTAFWIFMLQVDIWNGLVSEKFS